MKENASKINICINVNIFNKYKKKKWKFPANILFDQNDNLNVLM